MQTPGGSSLQRVIIVAITLCGKRKVARYKESPHASAKPARREMLRNQAEEGCFRGMA